MDLKTFVAETLCQIQEGVELAIQKRAESGGGGAINPHFSPFEEATKAIVEKVSFDVAITVTEGEQREGQAGLRVWSIGAGVAAKGAKSNEIVSRVQFSVPIVPPTTNVKQDESDDRRRRLASAPKSYGSIA
jgi:hypothetical protein